MSRKVRMVPVDWVHPTEFNQYQEKMVYRPMHEGNAHGGYESAAKEWDLGWANWQKGLMREGVNWVPLTEDEKGHVYTWYEGPRPSPDDYMPNWPDEQKTHYMMYEDTTEGTPISPAFATPEELARWLADNNASAFGGSTATYDEWLGMIKGPGSSFSMAIENGQMRTGVSVAADSNTEGSE